MADGTPSSDRTLYVTGIHEDVTRELLIELFYQCGPLVDVTLTDRNGFRMAFVEFEDSESIPFACNVNRDVKLFGRQLDIRPRQGSKHMTGFLKVARTLRGGDNTQGDFDTPSSSGTDRSPVMVDSRHHRHMLPTQTHRPSGSDSMHRQHLTQQQHQYNGSYGMPSGGSLLPPPPPPPMSGQWLQPPQMQPIMPAQLYTDPPPQMMRQRSPQFTAATGHTPRLHSNAVDARGSDVLHAYRPSMQFDSSIWQQPPMSTSPDMTDATLAGRPMRPPVRERGGASAKHNGRRQQYDNGYNQRGW